MRTAFTVLFALLFGLPGMAIFGKPLGALIGLALGIFSGRQMEKAFFGDRPKVLPGTPLYGKNAEDPAKGGYLKSDGA